jgi:histone-lysine N-methyltransferase ASH1L
MRYECNENNCAVGIGCTNRRISTSNEQDLQAEVFNAGLCGKGLRATKSLEQNEVVIEYTGEIITTMEAEMLLATAYRWDMVS